MNDIQVFQDVQFGQVRAIIIKNEPWFIGKDVCATLGYARPDNAVTDRVDEEDRIYVDSKTRPEIKDKIDYRELGQRGGWLINESGLYAVIFGSQLESAKAFKKWVTSKVLPSIRKTGGYKQENAGDVQGQIKLLAQGETELYQRVDEVTEDVKSVRKDLEKFKADIPAFNMDTKDIQNALRKKAIEVLGGKDSNAYRDRSIHAYTFADIQIELRRQFGVRRYDQIRHKDVADAMKIIAEYNPPLHIRDKIAMANAQQTFDLEGGVYHG